MVKVVPLPGPAVDGNAGAHGDEKRARLERADSEPALLGGREGLEQAVADEVDVHAAALVDDADGNVRRRGRRRGR